MSGNPDILKALRTQQGERLKISALFRDDFILAVDKPAGIPVIPDRTGKYDYNMRDVLADALNQKIYVVHRLDTDTSGVLLFALDEQSHKNLSLSFEKNKIIKRYLALVKGRPPGESGTIDKPLMTVESGKIYAKIDAQGKRAVTHYKLLENFGRYSFVELRPETGRMHQIRVHLKSIGCPLAVDPLYSSEKPVDLSMIKIRYRLKKNMETPNALIKRLTLHAESISFDHPISAKKIEITAPLPKDFRAVLNALKKWTN